MVKTNSVLQGSGTASTRKQGHQTKYQMTSCAPVPFVIPGASSLNQKVSRDTAMSTVVHPRDSKASSARVVGDGGETGGVYVGKEWGDDGGGNKRHTVESNDQDAATRASLRRNNSSSVTERDTAEEEEEQKERTPPNMVRTTKQERPCSLRLRFFIFLLNVVFI